MKPTQNLSKSSTEREILVFGAHPDDIEYGCGAVLASESLRGRFANFIVCSKGEAGSSGSAETRAKEAAKAASILGAELELIELDGDSKLELSNAHAIKLARIIRRLRPKVVLAPSLVENQHPDHWRLGKLLRDAARLARYGGLAELKDLKPHFIKQLFYYAITPESEPTDINPVYFDVSESAIIQTWTAAMNAHESQLSVRSYVDLQITRAKLLGARAGVEYAAALYPNEPLLFDSLSQAGRGARNY